MKKFSKLAICIAVLTLLGTTAAFAAGVKPESVKAEYKDGTVYVTGTTGDDTTLAVMTEIRNPAGKTVAMQTCAVTGRTFSTEFTDAGLVTGITYKVYAADFNGSAWSSAEFRIPETKKEEQKQSGTDTSVTIVRPNNTGTWNAPVTDGTWSADAKGNWYYKTNGLFRKTWGYIRNPYAKEGQAKDGWFYFDADGKMLTGWQFIDGYWYYLNPVSDGNLGMCLLNTTTPDGYKVDNSGRWIP